MLLPLWRPGVDTTQAGLLSRKNPQAEPESVISGSGLLLSSWKAGPHYIKFRVQQAVDWISPHLAADSLIRRL